MILPKDILTRNKIRDAAICNFWLENELTNKEIAERFGISERRVGIIVFKNRQFLNLDKQYEKQKRIRWLKQQIKRRGNTAKDSADLVEQLRIELEGKGSDNSEQKGNQKVVIIINENDNGTENQSNERKISRAISIVNE